jgi:hypothetical protein
LFEKSAVARLWRLQAVKHAHTAALVVLQHAIDVVLPLQATAGRLPAFGLSSPAAAPVPDGLLPPLSAQA